MAGRPSTFIQEIFDLICERMAAGQTLREICRAEGMPPESTVRTWAVLDNPPGIAAQYARARRALCDFMADETLQIADDATNDYVERLNKEGKKESILDREHVTRSALRVSQRNWLLARLVRDVYGDKATVEHTGANGGPIQTQQVDDTRPSLMDVLARAKGDAPKDTRH